MEKELHILLHDRKTAYGIFRGNYTMPLIVFVHGLTSDKNEPKFYNGSRFFEKKGYATYRWNLYSWQDDARKLHECSMEIHGKDINAICKYFRLQGVEKIILVGHSMGALAILHAQQEVFDEVIFWDGSYKVERWLGGEPVMVEGKKAILINSGFFAALSEDIVREVNEIHYEERVSSLHKPLSLVYAGAGMLYEGYQAYWSQSKVHGKRFLIDGAGHNFDEDGVEERLFEATLSCLE